MEEETLPPIAPVQYAYLDHTADVQLHAWGQSLEEALQQLVIALYGYMTTEIARVQPVYSMDFEASGHDLQSLVYNLLDTCLYNFCAEPFFIGCTARVLRLDRPEIATTGAEAEDKVGGDQGREYSVHLRVWGESFDTKKHPPGTEVKAITYSNMQIMEHNQQQQQLEEQIDNDKKDGSDHKKEHINTDGKTEIFVIVDI